MVQKLITATGHMTAQTLSECTIFICHGTQEHTNGEGTALLPVPHTQSCKETVALSHQLSISSTVQIRKVYFVTVVTVIQGNVKGNVNGNVTLKKSGRGRGGAVGGFGLPQL